jgi:hypothetical protein
MAVPRPRNPLVREPDAASQRIERRRAASPSSASTRLPRRRPRTTLAVGVRRAPRPSGPRGGSSAHRPPTSACPRHNAPTSRRRASGDRRDQRGRPPATRVRRISPRRSPVATRTSKMTRACSRQTRSSPLASVIISSIARSMRPISTGVRTRQRVAAPSGDRSPRRGRS